MSPENSRLIRIPGELDVPVSNRILAILDTPAMQRLKSISQLGLVAHVYPGATHSRFEHSLGVYQLAQLVVDQLKSVDSSFQQDLTEEDEQVFLLAALLHDVGHWPYCHPIEDLGLSWVPRHEDLARDLICHGEVAERIDESWGINPTAVADFLTSAPEPSLVRQALKNVLNGPVDIDKMDYLRRDSLHAGVPYGRNFDLARLIKSLCLGATKQSLAITEKGKTAAEMLVFSRYVMFSEVYWHHAVRSATAMLQRLVFELSTDCQPTHWLQHSDADFGNHMQRLATGNSAIEPIADALFGRRRGLYKRIAQYSFTENSAVHDALSGLPYDQLVEVSAALAAQLSRLSGSALSASDVLIDAPPQKLEVQFRLDVRLKDVQDDNLFMPLGKLSPVVHTLATSQFDNYVKKVRIFVSPAHAPALKRLKSHLADCLLECANVTRNAQAQ